MPAPKEICFIIGMGRSGTTLLSTLINRHSQIHATPEAVFLIFFLNAYKNKTYFTEEEIELMFEQIKWFSYTHPWAGWNFDAEEVKQKTKDFVKAKTVTYTELCNFIYTNFKVNGMDKSEAVLLADKNPSYTLFADKINTTFAKSKFIYIVRDYRANVLSRKENVDLKSPEVKLNAWLWSFFNESALNFMHANKEKVLLIKYEDLVEDSACQLKKIFAFLGVKGIDLGLDENSQYKEVKQEEHTIPEGHEERFRKKYKDLSKPVNKDRLDAWKTGLTEEEIIACDSICGELGKEFGYKPVGKTELSSKYFSYYLKAKKEILKERLIYYMSPETKLQRLKKIYTKLGYAKQK
jgi:hypothetical protein